MNTAVAYAHRDHQDRLAQYRVVFTGETTEGERATVRELFPDGAPLLPDYAGLPQPEDGGSYELCGLSHVDEVPTEDANVHDFVARLLVTHWELHRSAPAAAAT